MTHVLIATWLLTCVALVGVAGAQQKESKKIEGWGIVVNPDGDCTLREDNGKVVIRVPEGVHDLWFGGMDATKRFNAPRVVQDVTGDFVAQVKVTADWKPQLARFYNGAGLVVWNSEQEYVRLERNFCINSQGQAFNFTSPMHDRAGKRVNAVKATADEFFQGRSTWLRVERTGQKLTTAISHDGRKWAETGVLTTELPAKVLVGIHVTNNSAAEFVVQFEDLEIGKK